MRVAILSLPLHTNYGGILQSYALKTTLERLGHIVTVFDTDKHPKTRPGYLRPLIWVYNYIQNYILRNEAAVFDNKILTRNYEDYLIRSRLTQKFIDDRISPRILKTLMEVKESDYDAIIIGSDQIWRPCYVGRIGLGNAYLKFAERWDIKRIAYAASFGTSEWEYNTAQTDYCKNLIQKFDAVSVREISGVRLCSQKFDCKAVNVLDPTLLLDDKDYTNLLDTPSTLGRGKVFSYVLDRSEIKDVILLKISAKLRKDVNNVIAESIGENTRPKTQASVEDWIASINNCDFVITDSFHACVFSILFKKPFIVIGNKERGLSRFNSLLAIFGLDAHMVNNVDDIREDLSSYSVPDSVYEVLRVQREISLRFLRDSLGNN